MKNIDSFLVNHLTLQSGLYVSRRDRHNGVTVTTFDLRLTRPNVEQPIDTGTMHTIEHLGATYLRNSNRSADIVYFGPMGCRTGFYLLMFGELNSTDVFDLVIDMCKFIVQYEGDIVGATPRECGNYSDQNLSSAIIYANQYMQSLIDNKRLSY
ncbi:MAG: S-ribosylhomocysteine lyase [Clostridia bacterium]|nr:S-ribosylhomocysteine lyase [Clostridia bacterium]